jgi:hypothetical protein
MPGASRSPARVVFYDGWGSRVDRAARSPPVISEMCARYTRAATDRRSPAGQPRASPRTGTNPHGVRSAACAHMSSSTSSAPRTTPGDGRDPPSAVMASERILRRPKGQSALRTPRVHKQGASPNPVESGLTYSALPCAVLCPMPCVCAEVDAAPLQASLMHRRRRRARPPRPHCPGLKPMPRL